MKHDIRLITPVITEGIRTLDDVAPLESADFTTSHVLLERGPSSIECEFDEALSVPDIIRRAVQAQEEGCSAVVIDCFGDPGLFPAREAVRIPVLGPGETSMHTAALLAGRFSVITVLEDVVPMIENCATVYGVDRQLASIRVVDMPVLEIESRYEEVTQRLAEQALLAIREDRARGIVLGCTGFLGCAEHIRNTLLNHDLDVPVLDPVPTTVLMAQSLVRGGLSHSKVAFRAPRSKEISGYELG